MSLQYNLDSNTAIIHMEFRNATGYIVMCSMERDYTLHPDPELEDMN